VTPATDILAECRRAGITLHTDGDSLKAKGPAGRVQALLPVIKAHKAELLTALSYRPADDPNTLAAAPETLWWRIANHCPDGRTIEMDAPSGLTLPQAQDYANRFFDGVEVTGLVPLAGAGATAGQPADLEALAADIATETGLSDAEVLALPDANDRGAIRTGSDPGRAEAWRCAARALTMPAEPVPAPGGTGFPRAVVVWTPAGRPALVWAESTEHAERLARWNPAPSTPGRNGT
jgi:hypothetical protein